MFFFTKDRGGWAFFFLRGIYLYLNDCVVVDVLISIDGIHPRSIGFNLERKHQGSELIQKYAMICIDLRRFVSWMFSFRNVLWVTTVDRSRLITGMDRFKDW